MQRVPVSAHVNLWHLFWLRNFAIGSQLCTIAFVQFFLGAHLPLPAMLFVIALEVLFNGFTWLYVMPRRSESDRELCFQLLVDIGMLSALLYLSGGVHNPFIQLYLLQIAISAAVLPWYLTIGLAACIIVCYALLSFGYRPLVMDRPQEMLDYYRAGTRVNFMVSVGLIVWFVGHMSRVLRQRDAELADARQLLLRDERAVALGVQAATVAHEIGTPLSTIAMLAEEMLNTARASHGALAPWLADLELLDRQISLCTSALAHLRDHKPVTGGRSRLNEWFGPFKKQWQLRHPHVKFTSFCPLAEDAIYLDDPICVGQILTILLDNAARASPDHVTLGYTLKAHHAGHPECVEFEICDTGPGIPAPLRASLGHAPVSSDCGGYGIGLYLAFSAAAKLGGTITVTDATAPGQFAGQDARGTRVRLKIPVTYEHEDAGVSAMPDFT